jgi:hypothetical protein
MAKGKEKSIDVMADKMYPAADGKAMVNWTGDAKVMRLGMSLHVFERDAPTPSDHPNKINSPGPMRYIAG